MNGSPLQLALREMQAAAMSRYTRVGMVLASALLAISGPFGTFESFSLGQRFAYWAAMVVACYLAGQGAAAFFLALLRGRIAQKWPRVIVTGLLSSLPITMIVLMVNGLAYQHLELAESLNIWLYTTLITMIVVVTLVTLREVMESRAPVAPAMGASEAPGPLPPPILERVPLPQRGRLLALLVEDHYVDIVTERGKTLVLMRLADAMRETGDVAGLQIHRSHWVARDAVVRVHRADGKVSVELSNGMRLPVSRGYLPAVKAAGLG